MIQENRKERRTEYKEGRLTLPLIRANGMIVVDVRECIDGELQLVYKGRERRARNRLAPRPRIGWN